MANSTVFFSGGRVEVPEYVIRLQPSQAITYQGEDVLAAKAAHEAALAAGQKHSVITLIQARFDGAPA